MADQEWWQTLNQDQGASARDRLQALQMDERDDPYQSAARQQIAQEALQAPPESFRGYSPGWDLGDILDNPVTDAAKWGLGAAGTALDTLARPVRTGIDEAANLLGGRQTDPYRVLESVWNPDAATSATSLRRRLLFNDIGEEGDGTTWGDVPDVLADLGVATVTDPLSYLLPGASKAGEAAAVGGRKLVGALSQAGRLAPEAEMLGNLGKAGVEGLEAASAGPRMKAGNFFRQAPEELPGYGPLATPSREMAQADAIREAEAFAGKKFTDETGNFLPRYGTGKAPRPTFTGEEPTLYQRYASGEQNVQLGVPFVSSLQTGPLLGPNAPQWAKTGLNALGAVADAPRQLLGGIMEHVPGARAAGDYILAGPYKAMTMLAQSIPARWVGDKVQAAADILLEPGVLNAGGRAAAEAEQFSAKLRTEVEPRIFEMNEIAQKAGLSAEERQLANGILPHYDPENPVATLRTFDADNAHVDAGKATPEQKFKKVSDQIALLPADKQNAIYAISQQHHAMNYRMDEVMRESGVGTGRLGDALRERLAKLKAEHEGVQAERATVQQKLGPRAPGALEQPVEREYVAALAPEVQANRAQWIRDYETAQNEGFRTNPTKAPLRGDAVIAITDKLDEVLSRAHGEEGYLWKRLKFKAGYDGEEQIQGLIRQGIGEDPAIKQLNEQIAHGSEDLKAVMGGAPGDANAIRAQIDTANAAITKRTSEIEQGVRNARGMTEQLPDGTNLIRALKGADLTTPLHEMAHVVRHALPEEESKAVATWLKTAHGIDVEKGWTREADEMYAKYFERYLKTGKAPTAELDGVFAKLKQWITEIYEHIKEKMGAEITPDIKAHFDRLLGGVDDEGRAFAKAGPKGSAPSTTGDHKVLDLGKTTLRTGLRKQAGVPDDIAHAMDGAYQTLIAGVDEDLPHGILLTYEMTKRVPAAGVDDLERAYAKASDTHGNSGGNFRPRQVKASDLKRPLEIADMGWGRDGVIELPEPVPVVVAKQDPSIKSGEIAVRFNSERNPAAIRQQSGRSPAGVREHSVSGAPTTHDPAFPKPSLAPVDPAAPSKITGAPAADTLDKQIAAVEYVIKNPLDPSFVRPEDIKMLDALKAEKSARAGLPDKAGNIRSKPRYTAAEIRAMPVLPPEVVEDVFGRVADKYGLPRVAMFNEGTVKGGSRISEISLGVFSPNTSEGRSGIGEVAGRKVDSILHEIMHTIDHQGGSVNKGLRGPGVVGKHAPSEDFKQDLISLQRSPTDPNKILRDKIRPELADKIDHMLKTMSEQPEWLKRMKDYDTIKGDVYLSSEQEKFARALEMGLAKGNDDLSAILEERHLGHEFPHGAEREKVADAAEAVLKELKPYARDIEEQVYKAGSQTQTVKKTVHGLHQLGSRKVGESISQGEFESFQNDLADYFGHPRKAWGFEGTIKHVSKAPNDKVGGFYQRGEGAAREIGAEDISAAGHELVGHGLGEQAYKVAMGDRGQDVAENMFKDGLNYGGDIGELAHKAYLGSIAPDWTGEAGFKTALSKMRPEMQDALTDLGRFFQSKDLYGKAPVAPNWHRNLLAADERLGRRYASRPDEMFARLMEMGLARKPEFAHYFEGKFQGNAWYPQGREAEEAAKAAERVLDTLRPYSREVDGKTVFGLYQPSAEKVFESVRQRKFRDKSTALDSKIEALQNVINVTQKKVNAIPNYTPTIISDAARQLLAEKADGKRTPGDPSIGTPEKGFVGRAGEGKRNVMSREQTTAAGLPDSAYERLSARMEKGQYKYVDRELERLMPAASPETRASVQKALMPDPLEDVPLYPHEIEETFARGGTGTAATAGRGKLEPAFAVNDVVRQAFKPEALTKLHDEMTKGLTFAKQDPIEAIAKKFYGNVLPTATQAEMRQSFARTFQSVPVRAVNDVIAMAKEGRSLEEIEKAFKAQGYGRIEDMLSQDVWQGLKEGRLDAQDVFGAGFTPYGRVEMPDWAPKPGERGVQEAHYLSEPAAKEFAKQTAMYKDLGGTLGAIQPMIQTGLSYWKPFQTAYTLRYHIRNTVSDGMRMLQMGAIDNQTMGDIAKLYNPAFWKNYASTGLSRLEPWRGVQFDIGQGAQFFGGRNIVSGEEIMKLLAEKGVLSSGREAQELFNATSKALKPGQKASTYATGVGFLDKAKRALAYRDEANRVASFMTFLRKGQSVDEAVINTSRTLFDYKKLSPAMDFLRKMGIAPFIGWAAKNIPAQVEFALKNPGIVAGVFRATQMAQDGSLPPEAMPSYMRNKLGIRMGTRTNSATGREEAVVYGVGGIIPLLDLVEATNDPKGVITGQLAPWLKYGLDQMMDETPDEQLSSIVGVPGAIASKAYGALTGEIGPGGEKRTFGELGLSLINPASVKPVDVKRAVLRADHDAKSDERIARSKYIQTQARLNQAIATFGAEDPSLEPMKRAKDMAKREFFAAKARMERVEQQLVRQQAVP